MELKNGGADEREHSGHFPQSEVVEILELPAKKPVLTESFLKQKYVIEGLSSAEIGAQVFSSRTHITKKLNEFGIPLKMITRRETGKTVYGYRQHAGRAIEVKKEEDVIDMIKSYRRSGYSYNKISDILNKSKIQTKKRKGVWYSKVVRQIFLRTL